MEEAVNARNVSFAGKRVYIGLDVHRAFFVASCMCEGVLVKRCRMPAKSESVISLISKYFRGSEVKTCYEAGYSGFWLHRELIAGGVSNIVVHAASIEVAANDRVKTDKRDSLKMATQLEAGRLKGIRIPSIEQEQKRLLARTREQLVRARTRVRVQIRMRLHQFGMFPEETEAVLSLKEVRALIERLEDGEFKGALQALYEQWVSLSEGIKKLNKQMKAQASTDPLEKLYRSVPGIGAFAARVLSTELGDMSDFQNVRSLYSFTGLTPGEYSSGGKICRGHISRQGSSRLRQVLVEAAWVAIRKDSVMREFFETIAKKSGKKKAIVATARKLIGRVRAIVRDSNLYKVGYKEAA